MGGKKFGTPKKILQNLDVHKHFLNKIRKALTNERE